MARFRHPVSVWRKGFQVFCAVKFHQCDRFYYEDICYANLRELCVQSLLQAGIVLPVYRAKIVCHVYTALWHRAALFCQQILCTCGTVTKKIWWNIKSQWKNCISFWCVMFSKCWPMSHDQLSHAAWFSISAGWDVVFEKRTESFFFLRLQL